MLIGAYALGAYGHFRGTGGLDIFINATDENALKMIEACKAYGIDESTLSKDMFIVPQMVGIGELPFRIEILKKLDAIDFKYALERVKEFVIDGVNICVVDLNDLILLKEAAIKGRDKARDKEDLEFLNELKKNIKRR